MFKILIIDDDPVIRLILKKSLQNQGYDVTVASNGEEGIAQAQQVRPALIICDWMMSHLKYPYRGLGNKQRISRG